MSAVGDARKRQQEAHRDAKALTAVAQLIEAKRDAEAEVQRLRDRIKKVLAIHQDAGESQGFFGASEYGSREHCCGTCGEYGEYGVEWPCATARAFLEVTDGVDQ